MGAGASVGSNFTPFKGTGWKELLGNEKALGLVELLLPQLPELVTDTIVDLASSAQQATPAHFHTALKLLDLGSVRGSLDTDCIGRALFSEDVNGGTPWKFNTTWDRMLCVDDALGLCLQLMRFVSALEPTYAMCSGLAQARGALVTSLLAGDLEPQVDYAAVERVMQKRSVVLSLSRLPGFHAQLKVLTQKAPSSISAVLGVVVAEVVELCLRGRRSEAGALVSFGESLVETDEQRSMLVASEQDLQKALKCLPPSDLIDDGSTVWDILSTTAKPESKPLVALLLSLIAPLATDYLLNLIVCDLTEAEDLLRQQADGQISLELDWQKMQEELLRNLYKPAGTLRVTVVEAKGLKYMERGGADPYVKVSLVGSFLPQGQVEVGRTPARQDTLDPKFDAVCEEQLSQKILRARPCIVASVWDQDAGADADDPMGEVAVPLQKVLCGATTSGWFPMRDCRGCSGATGKLSLTFEWKLFEKPVGTLKLTVVSASGLVAVDSGGRWSKGSSDPYCVAFLGGAEVVRTHAVTKDLNPVWNCSGEASVIPSNGSELIFDVYDKDKDDDDDPMGRAVCPLQTAMDSQVDVQLEVKPCHGCRKATGTIMVSFEFEAAN